MVIASIALFVSLGGVSYGVATGSIDSREIKNNDVRTKDLRNNDVRGSDIRASTIAGSDVASNTLTGSDISESSLGTVPSAASAGRANTAGFANSAGTAASATSAGDADTVDGNTIRKFQLFTTGNQAVADLVSVNGLTLRGGCVAATPAFEAVTAADDAQIRSYTVNAAGGGAVQNTVFDTDWNTSENPKNLVATEAVGVVGTTVFRAANGRVATVSWMSGDAAGGASTCSIVGTVVTG